MFSQQTVGRQVNIVAGAEANITAYIKPVISFLLWGMLPIVLYPKLGVTAQFDIGSGSGCSNFLSPHYQMYGELSGGIFIEPSLQITVPVINKQVEGLGRPYLPTGQEVDIVK